MSSEECFEETTLLIPEGLDRRGWCGPEKSRQHWLVMVGSGEQGAGPGPAGRDSGHGDGAVARGGAHTLASEVWQCL